MNVFLVWWLRRRGSGVLCFFFFWKFYWNGFVFWFEGIGVVCWFYFGWCFILDFEWGFLFLVEWGCFNCCFCWGLGWDWLVLGCVNCWWWGRKLVWLVERLLGCFLVDLFLSVFGYVGGWWLGYCWVSLVSNV